jgi:NAD(P)-dependent dehydrogenase (short-subunit alcohol dehydrogenase family)
MGTSASTTGRLSDKVAIVTGATSGIGAATALLFAQEGANVVLTGRRASLGSEVEARCRQTGAQCVFVEADHTREADCQRVVATTLAEFQRIDVLFNNAGIVSPGTADTTSEALWQTTLDINVTAVWRMCKLVIPHMRKRKSGTIVNNASYWSVVGGENALPYVTSKGAVAQMTKAMALDHAREGIRVNAVCPGGTFVDRWAGRFQDKADPEGAIKEASAHIPMQRFASPEEIARAVLFLATDESSYVTGHLLLVDGGNTAQ